MRLLIYSILFICTPMAFALPPVFVNLSDSAYAGTYYNPYNNDTQLVGTNTQHTSATGFLPQISGTVGDIATAVLARPDSVPSPIDDGSSMPVTWNAKTSASASGSVNMGALHATCYSVQEITPFTVSYVQTDTNGNTHENTSVNPLIATGSAQVDLSAQDAVNVIGTLPPGTLVRVRLRLVVDCGVSAPGEGTFAQVTAEAYCQVQNGSQNYDTDILDFNSEVDGADINTSEVFSVPIGSTLYVNQSLSARASASSDLGNTGGSLPLSAKPPTSTANADAGNTAHFYLDVLDAGGSLSSTSGHNYSTPPPLALATTNTPGLTLSASCLPLQPWVLQYSSNLMNWVDAGTNQSDTNGQLQIPLPAPNASSKFYRLRSP